MREYVVRWALTLTTVTAWVWLSIAVLDLAQPWPSVFGMPVGLFCWFMFDPFIQRKERLW